MSSKSDTEAVLNPEPHLKEQDEGIIEAFSREDHTVLTVSEIQAHTSLSKRQLRRRLDDLEEEGWISQRTPSRMRLAWLERDVKEPITVQYPLLKLIRDRPSLQFFVAGMVIGILAVFVLLPATLLLGSDFNLSFVNANELLFWGVLIAVTSAIFIIAAVLTAGFEALLQRFGYEIQSAFEEAESEEETE
jgi:hypothetical protein